MSDVFIANNPLKLVTLTGTLTKNSLTLSSRFCPGYIEIRNGNWNICVKDISYENNSGILQILFLNIKCNLVHARKYNENNQIEVFETTLQRLEIFPVMTTLINFPKGDWFSVNNVSEDLKLNLDFSPYKPNRHQVFNLKVTVSVLMFRFQ